MMLADNLAADIDGFASHALTMLREHPDLDGVTLPESRDVDGASA